MIVIITFMEVIMTLKIFLRQNPLARKIFGRKEIIIIQKQISGIHLTQSEKNRLSRDIRPKFRFIKEVVKFKDEFDLKKGFENKKIICEAREIILNDKLAYKIKRIFLFGSIVEDKMNIRSDIDIAVVFDRITREEAMIFRARIAGRVSDKVDIQVFNILPEKIKKEILKKHKILY